MSKRESASCEGRIRTGWLLAASLLACAALWIGGRWALSRGFAALFARWGVDAGNIGRAPTWARLVFAWHGGAITLALSAATLALSRALRRLWRPVRARKDSARALLPAALIGLAGAAAVAALCLLPDSSRLAWPLTAPRLSAALIPLGAVSLAGTLAGEAFTRRVLYDGVRARWGRGWATLIACLALALTGVGLPRDVLSAVNALLLGALCCAVYDKYGLWASTGARWGWSLGCALLLGFGGGDAAVYRMYGVSERLLTGGDAGPTAGLWATLVLIAGIARLAPPRLPKGQKKRGEPAAPRASARG